MGSALPPGVEGTEWVFLSLSPSWGGDPIGLSCALVVCGGMSGSMWKTFVEIGQLYHFIF